MADQDLSVVNARLESRVEALEAARENLDDLLNAAGIPILALDMNLNIRWFTPAIEALIELTPSDIGQPAAGFARKFDDARFLDDARAVLQGHPPLEQEVQGEGNRWYMRRTVPIHTRDGYASGLVTTFVDTTRRHEAFDELHRILEAAPDPTVVIDISGRIERANAELLRVFGYSAKELIGRPVETLMPERFRRKHRTNVRGFFASPQARPMGEGLTLFAITKDGREFPIDVKLSPTHIDEHFVTIGAIRDITKQKGLEDRLHGNQRILERRVAERTVELQRLQTELHRAMRLAELGELTTGIAHEITQPLTAIRSYMEACQTLLAMDDFASAKDLGRKALDQARRAIDIIQNIRAMAVATENRRSAQDINGLVNDATLLMIAGARDRQIEMELSPAPGLPLVVADRVQIQQVLLNVLRNAIDSVSEVSRRRIMVETRRGNDSMVEIAVVDTGPGVPAEIAQRLFQPFVTTKAGGMGIGLSLSRSIIEAHDGRLTFANRHSGGTEFIIALPPAETG